MSEQSPNVIELILDIHEKVTETREDMAALKANMETEQERTKGLEKDVKALQKQVNLAHGAVAFIFASGGIVGLIKLLG